ncbi:DoxX family protein [bacterium]|nr:DoxX family protein [bacterium]
MRDKNDFSEGTLALKNLLLEPPMENSLNIRWTFRHYFALFARLVLAAVFIYAAFGKINNPLIFAEEIRMYEILDLSPLLYIIAIVLPWVELLCGIAFITGIFIRGASFTLAIMNMGFIAVIAYRTLSIMNSGDTSFLNVFFDCGCGFGPTYAWKKLLEDTGLLGLSLILLFTREHRFVLLRLRK